MWFLQAGALQEKGRVLAPDLPGFGSRPPLPPSDRRPEAYADWVAAWLAEQGVGPAAVLGYSMGGTVALLLALRHPERVRRLTLCCCSPCWGRGARRWLGSLFAGVGGRPAMEIFQATVAWGCRRLLPPGAQRDEVLDMVARAHRPTMRSLYLALIALDLTASLRRLDLPAHVIGGGGDWLAPPSHLRLLAQGLPQGQLHVIPGARHLLCLSHSTRFTQILRRSLAEPGPAAG